MLLGFALGMPEIFILGILCTMMLALVVAGVVLVVVLNRPRPPDERQDRSESERRKADDSGIHLP
jgi:hypothetical protein